MGMNLSVLNPTDKVRVTSLVVVLNPTVLIPTPLEFPVGIISGVTGFIPVVFLRILTWESPKVYLQFYIFILFTSFTIKY